VSEATARLGLGFGYAVGGENFFQLQETRTQQVFLNWKLPRGTREVARIAMGGTVDMVALNG
jgi:hypothetical protein